MSTFAVFGMTRDVALSEARKKVSTTRRDDSGHSLHRVRNALPALTPPLTPSGATSQGATMDRYTLHLGDCLEVMQRLPDASVDLVLADLPYGTTQCAWDVVIPFDALWEQYLRVSKPEAAIVLCAAQPFASLVVASNPAHYRYEWIWEKGHATGHLNAKKQPLRAHESAQVFYRKQPVYNPQMTQGHTRKTSTKRGDRTQVYGSQTISALDYDSTERYPRSVQFFSSDKQRSSVHPTQKPVGWMAFLISTYTNSGGLVLDNTMGSGTTGVACMQLGRSFVGIERDVQYFEIAQHRIQAAQIEADTPAPQLEIFA